MNNIRQIIGVELQGGLGNQLFQYAVGRALAIKHDSNLTLNLHILKKDSKRKLGLDAFPIIASTVDTSEFQIPGRLERLCARMGVRTGVLKTYPLEKSRFDEDDSKGCWDERILSVRPPAILHGYFQSERYFKNISTDLRKELIPINKPSETFHQVAYKIHMAGQASTSIHVRRGDYASDPHTLAFHGLLGNEYYGPALSHLRDKVPDAKLFVFTDDPIAAAELFPPNMGVTYISGQGLSDVDELMLMSKCRHHIIANSSYSWWGAWLGSNDGLTIAPRRWFAKATEAAICDRFPLDWYIIS